MNVLELVLISVFMPIFNIGIFVNNILHNDILGKRDLACVWGREFGPKEHSRINSDQFVFYYFGNSKNYEFCNQYELLGLQSIYKCSFSLTHNNAILTEH